MKWVFTAAVSFVLMGTFIGYFAGVKEVFTLQASGAATPCQGRSLALCRPWVSTMK